LNKRLWIPNKDQRVEAHSVLNVLGCPAIAQVTIDPSQQGKERDANYAECNHVVEQNGVRHVPGPEVLCYIVTKIGHGAIQIRTEASELGHYREGTMSTGDAVRLPAGSLDQLGTGLSRLPLDQRGYITAEDYERLTGEELDEFSVDGRKTIANLAAEHGCAIEMSSPIERRIYFTKSK
jgi:hypothetical protein